jgi:hypothetical protein
MQYVARLFSRSKMAIFAPDGAILSRLSPDGRNMLIMHPGVSFGQLRNIGQFAP